MCLWKKKTNQVLMIGSMFIRMSLDGIKEGTIKIIQALLRLRRIAYIGKQN